MDERRTVPTRRMVSGTQAHGQPMGRPPAPEPAVRLPAIGAADTAERDPGGRGWGAVA